MVGVGAEDGLSVMPARDIESDFPKLRGEDYRITSDHTTDYNCFAWAAHDTADWWSPIPLAGYYWPDQIARNMPSKHLWLFTNTRAGLCLVRMEHSRRALKKWLSTRARPGM